MYVIQNENFSNNNDFAPVNGTLCLDFLRDAGFPATCYYCYQCLVNKQPIIFGASILNKAMKVTDESYSEKNHHFCPEVPGVFTTNNFIYYP